ncbi:aldo/keto reductase [Thalassospiraceae bacterium LMO-JJ14]|nr:aldo/keto reductase [Thalassospiraceae bacterium LMO-JJ14]
MKYAGLGTSGLKVSPICLGAMTFGKQTSPQVAAKMVGLARDAGVNFIDTAESYVMGESEKIVGKLIKKDRSDWVVATKLGSKAVGDGPNQRGLSRAWMIDGLNASLKRLGTDYVDIYYLHRADPTTPLVETLETMGELIRAGKVRYWGFSNFRAWKIADMVHLCRELGVPKPVIAQPFYNAIYRVPELEYLPACQEFGIGVVPYSPLARGVLTGKYGLDVGSAKDTKRGAGEIDTYGDVYTRDCLRIAAKIKARAQARGMTAGDMAINWLLNNRIVSSIVTGPRTLAHWKAYLGALEHAFTAADEAFFEKLVPGCYPLGIGYTEQKDPPQGRVTYT